MVPDLLLGSLGVIPGLVPSEAQNLINSDTFTSKLRTKARICYGINKAERPLNHFNGLKKKHNYFPKWQKMKNLNVLQYVSTYW